MRKRTWQICPACEGEGTCVNPNIDANGLSYSELHADPDFYEEYMGGTYDVHCNACKGSGKITDERMTELRENAESRRMAAMENGSFADWCGAGDYRFG